MTIHSIDPCRVIRIVIVQIDIPFRPAIIDHTVVRPENRVQRRAPAAHDPSGVTMHSIVGRAFDLLAEGEEVRVPENGIQFSGADCRHAGHTRIVPGEKKGAARIQEGGVNIGILIPIPVR